MTVGDETDDETDSWSSREKDTEEQNLWSVEYDLGDEKQVDLFPDSYLERPEVEGTVREVREVYEPQYLRKKYSSSDVDLPVSDDIFRQYEKSSKLQDLKTSGISLPSERTSEEHVIHQFSDEPRKTYIVDANLPEKLKAHMDPGATVGTSPWKEILHGYKKYSEEEKRHAPLLRVADNQAHSPVGEGHICIPDRQGNKRYFRQYHCPGIPHLIVSSHSIAKQYNCGGFLLSGRLDKRQSYILFSECDSGKFILNLSPRRGLYYTDTAVLPSGEEQVNAVDICTCHSVDCSVEELESVFELSSVQKKDLWHCRLNHINYGTGADAHKFAEGVPKLGRADELHKCEFCQRCKARKDAKGHEIKRDPDTLLPWEHIQMDAGFIVANPKKDVKFQEPEPVPAEDLKQLYQESVEDSGMEFIFMNDTGEEVSYEDFEPIPEQLTDEEYPWEEILDHKSRKNVRNRKDCLKILWRNGDITWNTDQTFDPADVRAYLERKGLLDHPYWKHYKSVPKKASAEYDEIPDDVPREHSTSSDDPKKPLRRSARLAKSNETSTDASPSVGESGASPIRVPSKRSTNSKKAKRTHRKTKRQQIIGLNGETCYFALRCEGTGAIVVFICKSKVVPRDTIVRWLQRHKPNGGAKRIRIDGGESNNRYFVESLEKEGYTVETTGPASSFEIGQVERLHLTLKNGIRTMLHASALPFKFWPYALWHHVFLMNCVPQAGRTLSPIELITGKRPNLSKLRIFGCRVYAIPTDARTNTLEDHTRPGVFLGYRNTFRHPIYYDFDTHLVKTARHIVFDESKGYTDESPPYMRLLKRNNEPLRHALDAHTPQDDPDMFDIALTPFNETHTFSFNPLKDHLDKRFKLVDDYTFGHPVLSQINGKHDFGNVTHVSLRNATLNSYVIRIGDTPVFTAREFYNELSRLNKAGVTTVDIVFGVDQKRDIRPIGNENFLLRPTDLRQIEDDLDPIYSSPLLLDSDAIFNAAIHTFVAREGHKFSDSELRSYSALGEQLFRLSSDLQSTELGEGPPFSIATANGYREAREQFKRAHSSSHGTYTPADSDDLRIRTAEELAEVRRLQNSYMTEEESNLSSFTFKQLRKLKNWEDWRQARNKQLDAHFDCGTIGKAVPMPQDRRLVYSLVYANVVKDTGVRKVRACLNGSKQAAPWLRHLVKTYASAMELPAQRLFMALSAWEARVICFHDVVNAFQQSPPPSVQCYLFVDQELQEWYHERFGVLLDPKRHVLPLNGALQGHPEAGVLWENLVTDVLVNRMNFRTTTHERGLYRGTVSKHDILLCRQVDDIASSAEDETHGKDFFDEFSKYLKAEYLHMGLDDSDLGKVQRFNGADIIQTRHYVKTTCKTYLDRVLATHGFICGTEKDKERILPIPPSMYDSILNSIGPEEGTKEAKALADEMKFGYRAILGELVYAYVVARPDIGFAVGLLSRFSNAPHREHYNGLRHVMKYLRATRDKGIVYRRKTPVECLQDVPLALQKITDEVKDMPFNEGPRLHMIDDCAYATDPLKRRSVLGNIGMLAHGAIVYKSTLGQIVAVSSTEGEFYAFVKGAKIILYLRSLLEQLGFSPKQATNIYGDNTAVEFIVNDERPTQRTRHVDVQYFAVQQWRSRGLINAKRLAGPINAADSMTKPTPYDTFLPHMNYAMGMYDLDSYPGSRDFNAQQTPVASKSGRVLEHESQAA